MNSQLYSALLGLDAASLADTDKSIRVMDAGLRPVARGKKLVGVARTVRCNEDFLTVMQALDESQPGEVLVVDTGNSTRAVVGELFSIEAQRRGLAGIIVDGPVRDTRTIRELDMAVYARGFCPVSGTTQTLGQTQVPVICGGVEVVAGDILVGDDDGIVVASADDMAALIETATSIQRQEGIIQQRMRDGESLFSMLNYSDHAQARAAGKASNLAFQLDD
jgi:4-hydroxy-4-methyl-2-oxoglutarate aldolase